MAKTKVIVKESKFSLNDCPKCGRPKGTYKKGRTNNERVVCLRNSGALVIEERGEVHDQKQNIKEWLKELQDGTEKPLGDLKSAIDTVVKELDKYPNDLGHMEPDLFEVGKCSIGDVIVELDQYRGCNTGFMPRDTVYFERTPIKNGSHKEIYVIAKPPGIVNFKYKSSDAAKEKLYRLSLPYLNVLVTLNVNGDTYAMDHQKTFMFLTTSPLESSDQKIYRFPSHNTHREGNYCWGGVKADTSLPKNQMVHGVMNLLFNSVWNNHIARAEVDKIPTELGGSYESWDAKTKENAFCGLSKEIKWLPLTRTKITFSDLRKEMLTS